MKKLSTVLITFVFVVSMSTASWAVILPFSQDTGFDTTPGTLLSIDASPTNDIRWNTTIPGLPGDLPAGYSIVSPTSPYFNTITWGGGNNVGGLGGNNWGSSTYSGLRVLGFAGNTTVGDWTTISRVFHQNNVLPSSTSTLLSAVIHSRLTVGNTDVNNVPFTFTETPNNGSCTGAPPGLGSCPDVFTFNALGFAPVVFNYSPTETYIAEFRFANFQGSVLDDSADPVLSLWTSEGTTSSADVQFRLTRTVPEPASMALFGMGLVGVAIRRKLNM